MSQRWVIINAYNQTIFNGSKSLTCFDQPRPGLIVKTWNTQTAVNKVIAKKVYPECYEAVLVDCVYDDISNVWKLA